MRSQRALSSPTGQKPSIPQTPWAFLLDEFIGRQLVVLDASGKDLRGQTGCIVDETRGTFLVLTRSGRKRIPKKGSVFRFPELSSRNVPGDWLISRPEERTKRLSARLMR